MDKNMSLEAEQLETLTTIIVNREDLTPAQEASLEAQEEDDDIYHFDNDEH
ncbi:MAG: hypothetical protein ACMUJM_08950 [bacterium]